MTIINVSRLKIVFILIYFAGSLLLSSQARAAAENTGDNFGFAESLYEEGDYYRAIGEYKRYIFYNPDGPHTSEAALRIVECYFQAKRWQEGEAAADVFLKRYPESPFCTKVLYLKGIMEKSADKLNEALQTFATIAESKAPDYSEKALYQMALIRLGQRDWQGAQELLDRIQADSPLHAVSQAFRDEIRKGRLLPRKSPLVAGLLAGALPGTGHLYTERPKDALTAFLLNGIFIWGAAELFQDDNYAAGGILAFFEIGWYTGNIYSAVSSTHKYNKRKEEEFIHQMVNRFTLSLRNDKQSRSVLLSYHF